MTRCKNIWDIPFGKSIENGVLKKAFNGFQLTGKVNVQSGKPFTIYDCTNASLTTCIRFTPTGPITFGSPGRLTPSGDPNGFIYTDLRNQTGSTFTDASGGTEVGPFPSDMLPRNSFRGPGFWNVDLGLFKNVDLTERFRIQLRAEAFNVFNHQNYSINGGSLDFSGTQFVTASKSGRRNIQLALKFIF